MYDLSKFSKSKTLVVKSKQYGNITVSISNDNKIGSNYYVMSDKEDIEISALIDGDGNEIIPFSKAVLEDYFTANNGNDICLAFKIDGIEDLKYYHFQKLNGKHELVRSTDPYVELPLSIIRIKEYPDYWLLCKTCDEIECQEYAIYDPKLKTTITSFFHELNFNVDSNSYGHFVYFCKYIYSIVEDEIADDYEVLNHTSLCGFMDINGNFSSQLLDTEGLNNDSGGTLYNSYFVGGNSISNEYYSFVNNLTHQYLNQYHEKDKEIDLTLTYLFNHSNQSTPPDNHHNKKPAKILEFKKDR